MKQDRKIFPLAALALFAGACVVNMEDGGTAAADNEKRLVTLALAVPGSPVSRALDEDDENEVKAIDVLLFTTDGNDYFYYRAVGSNIADDGPSSRKKFTVRLPEGTWNVVVLANARDAFDNAAYDYKALLAPSTPAATNVSRANVLDGLVMQLSNPANPTGKWPGGTFKGIPMWGYYNGLTIGSTPITPTIDLTRAITRVNISVSATAQDNFALESVRLYNYNRAGSLAPVVDNGPGNVDGYDGDQWQYFATPLPARFKAAAPNVPALGLGLLADDASAIKLLGPLVYDVDNAIHPGVSPVFTYAREIYAFEAAAGSGSGKATNTCLVIGGYYKETAAAAYATDPTYYRVEFVDNEEHFLALLRNHSYNVAIQTVDGEGDQTPWGAFNAKAVNMKAEILPWDDGTFSDVVFDGQNYLGVKPGELALYRDAKTGNRFTVTTDVATGWTLDATDSQQEGGAAVDWISNLSGSSPVAGSGDVTFDVSENISGAPRVAYIHVKAGRLDFAVKVTQGITPDIGMWITDAAGVNDVQELIFSSVVGVAPAVQQFRLRWAPAGATVAVDRSAVAGVTDLFAYAATSDTPGTGTMTYVSDPNGTKVISIIPPTLSQADVDNDPFIRRSSKIDFTVTTGSSTVSRSIYLHQIRFQTIPDVLANQYVLDGSTYTIPVRSNTEWYIRLVDDPAGILQDKSQLEMASGGYNTSPGDEITFQMINDPSKGGVVTLTFTDPTSRVGDVVVWFGPCGRNGLALLRRIGNNDYLTHEYNGKCWMVQNSKEGTFSGKAFGLGPDGLPFGSATNAGAGDYTAYVGQGNGYYYTWQQANAVNNACPAGWHLPTAAEIHALKPVVEGDLYGVGRWWAGNSADAVKYVMVGVHNGYSGYWYYWGNTSGFWWASDEPTHYYAWYGSLTGFITGPDRANEAHQHWYSVRCVQD